jgi:hypothetical protein
MRVFENRVLRRMMGAKREEVTESKGKCIMRSFVMCSVSPNIIRIIK